MRGTVKKLLSEKRCGFIVGEDKKDYFFHSSSLKSVRFEEIEIGDEVEFEESEGEKGLRAEEVYLA